MDLKNNIQRKMKISAYIALLIFGLFLQTQAQAQISEMLPERTETEKRHKCVGDAVYVVEEKTQACFNGLVNGREREKVSFGERRKIENFCFEHSYKDIHKRINLCEKG